MNRLLALFLALFPIVLAVIGIKWMRDAVFGILNSPIPSLSLQFIFGFFFFGIGMYLFGGFILYRDRKRNKVQLRFRKDK